MQREPSEGAKKIKPTYELSPDELSRLTNELIVDKTKGMPENQRFVTVEVNPDEEYSNIARHIEQHLDFFEEDNLAAGFQPYEEASRFFISLDRTQGEATGVIRVIENSPAGFETTNELSGPDFNIAEGDWIKQHNVTNLDKVWDIASLAVLPKHRDGTVSLQLYRALYKSAVEVHGIEVFIALLDKDARDKLENFFGVMLQALAGSPGAPYHHSEWTYPVYGNLREMYVNARRRMETLTSKAASRAAQILVMGAKDESLVLDTEN